MENIKIIETLSDGTQRELCISDVINRFISKKSEEYIGENNFDKQIMIDWNGINIITKNENGDIIKIDCMENL